MSPRRQRPAQPDGAPSGWIGYRVARAPCPNSTHSPASVTNAPVEFAQCRDGARMVTRRRRREDEEDNDVSELRRPTVEVPEGPAPTELVIEDQVVGDGPEAIVGSQIQAHYVGVAHSTGRQFDSSWNRGSPLEFRLGTGRVIKGWDDGIVGMRVGGRRRLTI